jgi:hypothetical protein
MKNYIGRKCKGFRFEDGTDGLEWNPMMRHHIKEVGVIEIQYKNSVRVQFEGYNWSYPISLIEPHLIPEVKKYTKEELVKILGHDFEII